MEKLNMPVANLAIGIYTEDSLELILSASSVSAFVPGSEQPLTNTLNALINTVSFIIEDMVYVSGGWSGYGSGY